MANQRQGKEFLLKTEEETQRLGEKFALGLSAGDVLCLNGSLGAGKTNFVKGLAKGLGYSGEVTSPSFPLVHEYEGGRLFLAHFDFFRLNKEEEIYTLGFFDYLKHCVLAIEWGSKFSKILPSNTQVINFEIVSIGRRLIFEPPL